MILDIYAELMAAGTPMDAIDRMDILRCLDVLMRRQDRAAHTGKGGVALSDDGLPAARGTIDEVFG